MIKCKILVVMAFCSLLFFSKSNAQGMKQTESPKIYSEIMVDNFILQSSFFEKKNSSEIGPLRFSNVLNGGYHLHKDFSAHFGIFSGLHLKNIGFIEKIQDSTIKRRVYTLGIPFMVKVGNMKKGNFIVGGGVDFPFHFKEKGFIKRNSKTKTNEWFSKRTQQVMPYAMVGYNFKIGMQFSLSFYPQNFLNPQFIDKVNQKPYTDYNVQLLLFSWSRNLTDGHGKKQIIPTKAPPLPNIL